MGLSILSSEIQQQQKWCRSCRRYTLHQATVKQIETVAGQLSCGIFMCIITLGLWLPILLIGMIQAMRGKLSKWHCQQCGRRN
jgi:hypothetical protein